MSSDNTQRKIYRVYSLLKYLQSARKLIGSAMNSELCKTKENRLGSNRIALSKSLDLSRLLKGDEMRLHLRLNGHLPKSNTKIVS